MKGAFPLTFDVAIIAKVRRAIAESGEAKPGGATSWQGCAVVYDAPDAIQVQELETDHLFSLDQYDDRPDFAGAYRDAPHVPAPGVMLPDFATIVAYGIDCRWEDLFVRLVREVAEISGEPAWILDDENVLWDARNVDPARVRL